MNDAKSKIFIPQYKNRWISYFDILGFKKLFEKHDLDFIISVYEEILADLDSKANEKKKYGIDYSWFSDTFLIFASDDSLKSFSLIEQASRLFFQRLILKEIPLRGALTVGELYTQKKKNIFLGKALIDAYEYGEKQNWLGFILTPSVYEHLKKNNFNLEERIYYRRVQEHLNIIKHPEKENVFAFTMNVLFINRKNKCLESIQDMKNHASQKDKEKYQNTEKFIISSDRLI